jgi:hypothetical protein
MACVNRACTAALLLALVIPGLAACGSRGDDHPPAPATLSDHGERFLSRAPEVGVACPRANSIACDRVGLAVWLKRPADRVTATIDGRPLRLHAGRPDGREAWYQGFLQPAGLLDGALKVTPDRGRLHWQGRHPKDARLRIVIRRASGATDRASLTVPLRAGWG